MQPKNKVEGYKGSKSESEQLRASLDRLNAGEMPNVLELLNILCTISNVVTPDGACPDCLKMGECRF